MNKFTLLFVSAALVLASIGCASQQTEARLNMLEENKHSDDARLEELYRYVADNRDNGQTNQIQINQLINTVFDLKRKLCQKDPSFCDNPPAD